MKKTMVFLLAAALLFTAGYAAAAVRRPTLTPAPVETTAPVETAAPRPTETPAAPAAEGSPEPVKASIPYWTKDSSAMESILTYVSSVTDESSGSFVPAEDRIAVFDLDGTLYGELFPTYFDVCLLMHRTLHDETFTAPADAVRYASALETALHNHLPEPRSAKSSAQYAAEAFRGLTVAKYRTYIRDFMSFPAYGFDGMTYGEGFYLPMVALVEYLAGHGFAIYISSGSERFLVRELIEGTLDRWIPASQVIGSSFSLIASGQGNTLGRNYDYGADDQIVLEGNLVTKNVMTNKVFSIIEEIGKPPLLVFGNSTGDLPMAQYALQNGGRGYMLLCDDTQRDYGDMDTAQAFAARCADLGLETISMRNDFATIYGESVTKSDGDFMDPAA